MAPEPYGILKRRTVYGPMASIVAAPVSMALVEDEV